MRRTFLSAIFLVSFCGTLALAADATVVNYDKDTLKLVVKEGEKERTIEVGPKIHVHDTDGKEIKLKDRHEKLKKDVKISIEEKNGKLVEINIKK